MVQSKVEYITEFGAASDNDEGILIILLYTVLSLDVYKCVFHILVM